MGANGEVEHVDYSSGSSSCQSDRVGSGAETDPGFPESSGEIDWEDIQRQQVPQKSAACTEAPASQLWGLFIGEDWRQDAKTVGERTPTIRVRLPDNVHGRMLVEELKSRYPAFKQCCAETVDIGMWAALGCIPGNELHSQQEKVVRMSPALNAPQSYNPRYAIVYMGQSAPSRLPAEPDLILPIPPADGVGPVLESLSQAAPRHRFRLRQRELDAGQPKWDELDGMEEVPPGSVHVWAEPMSDAKNTEPEGTDVLLPRAAHSSFPTARCHSALVRRKACQVSLD